MHCVEWYGSIEKENADVGTASNEAFKAALVQVFRHKDLGGFDLKSFHPLTAATSLKECDERRDDGWIFKDNVFENETPAQLGPSARHERYCSPRLQRFFCHPRPGPESFPDDLVGRMLPFHVDVHNTDRECKNF